MESSENVRASESQMTTAKETSSTRDSECGMERDKSKEVRDLTKCKIIQASIPTGNERGKKPKPGKLEMGSNWVKYYNGKDSKTHCGG